MPVVPARDGEIERRDSYTRLNPNGDEEFVRKRKGKQDEETLNELADDLMGLLEGIEFTAMPTLSAEQPDSQRVINQPTPPQFVASRGDPARAAGETLTNMTVAPQTSEMGLGLGPTPADAPDLARAKSPLTATPYGDKPTSKYITDYEGDGLDYGATHSESFTGTGAIAIMPAALGQPSSARPRKKDKNKDTRTPRSESNMSIRRKNGQPINEWLPPFKGAGYEPGEYQMPEPAGRGVQDRGVSQVDGVEAYDSELSGMGKEWPRKHNETAAMCDVDEDGVEHKPQGGHESTHATANDGIQKHMKDLNLRTPQKNTGSGVAEPFEGDRWSDGGVLNGSGPAADSWTHEEGPGMPDSGPITGTSGPQQGQPTNEWSPNKIGHLMGEDADIQSLFDSYARTASAVCLEDFQALCQAHGVSAVLDESSLLHMMETNQEFVFYEGNDANGPYWIAESCCPECGCEKCECEQTTKKGEGEHRRPFDECNDTRMKPRRRKKPVSEMQIRSPEEEAGLYTDDPFDTEDPDLYSGDPDVGSMLAPHGGGADPEGAHEELGSRYDERLGGMDDFDPTVPSALDDARSDVMGMPGDEISEMECPGCGYKGTDAECPECGAEMMDPMGDIEGDDGDMIGSVLNRKEEELADEGEYGSPADDRGMWESRQVLTGPQIVEGLKNFMQSAHSLIENNLQARRGDIAEALNYSWSFHAGDIDARTCPQKVRQTLQGLMNKFPGFDPLAESAMEKPDGTALGGGDGPKDNLPKQPTEMTTHGDKSLLGKSQTGGALAKTDADGVGGDLWVDGTGKKMTGKSVNENMMQQAPAAPAQPARQPQAPAGRPMQKPAAPVQQKPAAQPQQAPAAPAQQPAAPAGAATQVAQENINRLTKYVKKHLAEAANALRGQYKLQFSILVSEAKMPDFIKDKIEKKGKEKKPTKPTKKTKKRTPKRDSLAEALADAEEMLQMHAARDLTFEAAFLGPQGQVAMKQDIPLFTIMPRGPMVGEGKALFRFPRHAEAFADVLANEGVTCRVLPHNWGSAVLAKTNYTTAYRAFDMISEDDKKKKKWRLHQ